jgi:hypothetical protein
MALIETSCGQSDLAIIATNRESEARAVRSKRQGGPGSGWRHPWFQVDTEPHERLYYGMNRP